MHYLYTPSDIEVVEISDADNCHQLGKTGPSRIMPKAIENANFRNILCTFIEFFLQAAIFRVVAIRVIHIGNINIAKET